jgi:hypothetical protein
MEEGPLLKLMIRLFDVAAFVGLIVGLILLAQSI